MKAVAISTLSSICSVLLVIVCGLPLAQVTHITQSPAPSRGHALSGLHMPFVENRGQVDPRVAFYAPTFAGTAFVTRDGALVLTLGQTSSLVEQPIGTPGRPQGVEPAATRVDIITDRVHEQALATFGAVAVPSPWAGVALAYRAHGDNVERIFNVAPGADAGAIRMQVRGAQTLSERAGTLVAHTPAGDVTLSAPVAYQSVAGRRRDVPVRYRIRGDEYGFVLGAHDPRAAVVIDPLLQATYLQGEPSAGLDPNDYLGALALGPQGDLYAAGLTESAEFPGTSGGFMTALSGGGFFVARISPDLTTLLQATYYGVSNMQVSSLNTSSSVAAIAVNQSTGDVYVLGNLFCSGTCADLPKISGGAEPTNNSSNAFVAEFDGGLTNLLQATYVGSSAIDVASDMKLSSTGTVYVAGSTGSPNIGATTGGYQSTLGGSGVSNFIAEFSSDLTSYVQSTYLGNDGSQPRLAVASSGDVYLSGITGSNAFPGVTGGAQPALAGNKDEFVSRLSGDLKILDQSTYLGNGIADDVAALLVGSSGDVYAVANTEDKLFDASTGGAQSSNSATGGTCVVTRLFGDLTAVDMSTFLGGTTSANCGAAVLDAAGDVYVAGEAASDDPDTVQTMTAMTGGVEPRFFTSLEAGTGYIMKLSPDLTKFAQGTYFGGSQFDEASALVMGSADDLYVGGGTASADVYGTAGGLQGTSTGAIDSVYLGHFSDDLLAGDVLLKVKPSFSSGGSGSLTATLDIANDSATQPLTGLVLTIKLSGGVQLVNDLTISGLDCDGTKGTVHCLVEGRLIDSTLLDDSVLMPGESFSTDINVTSNDTSGAGTVTFSADQKFAAGSTKSIEVSAKAAGGSGGGGSSGSSGGGGGNFGLLLILGMAGLVAKRRRA